LKSGTTKSANALHRGITMHRLPVGGEFPGWVFAVGSMLIFLIALPSLWYFLGLAVLLGIGFAAILHFARR
jgi:hypothetical protein